jgi:hypothetical protein
MKPVAKMGHPAFVARQKTTTEILDFVQNDGFEQIMTASEQIMTASEQIMTASEQMSIRR